MTRQTIQLTSLRVDGSLTNFMSFQLYNWEIPPLLR
jgi:hypothetical protein